jgi:hypothetical protein
VGAEDGIGAAGSPHSRPINPSDGRINGAPGHGWRFMMVVNCRRDEGSVNHWLIAGRLLLRLLL